MLIEQVGKVSDELDEAIGRLLPQLSSDAQIPTRNDLERLVSSAAATLFIARLAKDGPITGMLTLAVYRLPTGLRAWIEDVVVDEAARGQGIGEALTREAIQLAAEAGAHAVDLTSRVEREAANRLYTRLGFERRGTNVYRYVISKSN
jgi:ribosomal protein S18 acetylase RimI-like enzyme